MCDNNLVLDRNIQDVITLEPVEVILLQDLLLGTVVHIKVMLHATSNIKLMLHATSIDRSGSDMSHPDQKMPRTALFLSLA